jgi:hypothetical protein
MEEDEQNSRRNEIERANSRNKSAQEQYKHDQESYNRDMKEYQKELSAKCYSCDGKRTKKCGYCNVRTSP